MKVFFFHSDRPICELFRRELEHLNELSTGGKVSFEVLDSLRGSFQRIVEESQDNQVLVVTGTKDAQDQLAEPVLLAMNDASSKIRIWLYTGTPREQWRSRAVIDEYLEMPDMLARQVAEKVFNYVRVVPA